ncbi:unnamed protein product [Amoebophrya sp. A25]|nr:unnamed protein product [Amoebophrya sp. A25]|eukprot:GSA25T00010545001.1
MPTTAPASGASGSRTLRISYGDKLFDWFDVDEEKEIINAPDVIKILKENVAHYFQVGVEQQILFDEEGPITTPAELRRSLKCAGKPRVTVADAKKLNKDHAEQWQAYMKDVQHLVTNNAELNDALTKALVPPLPMAPLGDHFGRARSLTPQLRLNRGISPQPGLSMPLMPSVPMRAQASPATGGGRGGGAFPGLIFGNGVASHVGAAGGTGHGNNNGASGVGGSAAYRATSVTPSGTTQQAGGHVPPAAFIQATANTSARSHIAADQVVTNGSAVFNAAGQRVFVGGQHSGAMTTTTAAGAAVNGTALGGATNSTTAPAQSTVAPTTTTVGSAPQTTGSGNATPAPALGVGNMITPPVLRSPMIQAAKLMNFGDRSSSVMNGGAPTASPMPGRSSGTTTVGFATPAPAGFTVGPTAQTMPGATGVPSSTAVPGLGNVAPKKILVQGATNSAVNGQHNSLMGLGGGVPQQMQNQNGRVQPVAGGGVNTASGVSPGFSFYPHVSSGSSSTVGYPGSNSSSKQSAGAQQVVSSAQPTLTGATATANKQVIIDYKNVNVQLTSNNNSGGLVTQVPQTTTTTTTVKKISPSSSQPVFTTTIPANAAQTISTQLHTHSSAAGAGLEQVSSQPLPYPDHGVGTPPLTAAAPYRRHTDESTGRHQATSADGEDKTPASAAGGAVVTEQVDQRQDFQAGASQQSVLTHEQASALAGSTRPDQVVEPVHVQSGTTGPETTTTGPGTTTEPVFSEVFAEQKQIVLELDKADLSDRFGFSSVPYAHGGLEITRVDRGGLLAQWNTVRRSGGPMNMVGVGDVILLVNNLGPADGEAMRGQLETSRIQLLVAKMRG